MSWRHLPKPMQLSASLLGGAVMLAVAYVALAGTPKPVLPSSALFEPVSIEQTLASSRPELSSFDFIFRPVFALTRKPPVQPDMPSAEEAAALAALEAEAVVVESIDGVNLLGIFGSGEVAGVIVRLDNGERQRVVVGESIKGWRLESIESRRARLRASSGEMASLEMVFATDQVPVGFADAEDAPAPNSPGQSEPAAQGAKAANTGSEEAAPEVAPITFESIYAKRRKKAEE